MLCEKCKNRVGKDAVSVGKCKLCGAQTYSGTSPAPIICQKCSEDSWLCEICGSPLYEQMTFDDLIGDDRNTD